MSTEAIILGVGVVAIAATMIGVMVFILGAGDDGIS